MMRTTLMVTSAFALILAISMPAQAQVLGIDGECEDDLATVNCIYYTDCQDPCGSVRHFCTLILLGNCLCWDPIFRCIP